MGTRIETWPSSKADKRGDETPRMDSQMQSCTMPGLFFLIPDPCSIIPVSGAIERL